MDARRFDDLLCAFVERASRRSLGRALAGLTLGAALGSVATEEVAAKKCPACRKKKHGKCKGKQPNGTPCGFDKVCTAGKCGCEPIAPGNSIPVGEACDPTRPQECVSGVCGCNGDVCPCTCRNADCVAPGADCTNTGTFGCCQGVCVGVNPPFSCST